MFSRLRAAAVLALLFAATSFGGPAPVTAYHDPFPGQCKGLGTTPHWAGDFENPGNVVGIDSYIDISGTNSSDSFFGTCIDNEFETNGAFAYVGLMSTTNSSRWVTLGVARCGRGLADYWFLNGPCDGTGSSGRPHPTWFVGWRACNNDMFLRRLDSAGDAGYGAHEYRIIRELEGVNRFKFRIDGVTKYSIDLDDPRISCWSTGDKKGWIAGEVVDEGDSLGLGDSADLKTQFYFMETKPQGGDWGAYTPNCTWVNPPANHHALNCGTTQDTLKVWTTPV